jgi:chromate reductase, NAD(P)H dehydrogenase (quinone)
MKTDRKFSIFGFVGSLRKGSYNKAIMRAAVEVAPENVVIEVFDLEGMPFFNQDLEREPSDKLKEFKTKIRAADAILIATPEYNYSMPGVLKNAIDCASRPYGDNAWQGKPAAMMGASVGMIATARAQYHLRQSMVFLDMHPVNQPEVMVPFADKKVDENGRLTDQPTRDKILELILALVEWTERLKGSAS